MRLWDAVVVGGGPAGLTAGFYLSRAGFRTLLIERDKLGGQAARIPVLHNYPGHPGGVKGRLLMKRLARQALGWGLAIRAAEASRVRDSGGRWELSLRDGKSVRAKAVIVATGSEFLPLGVPGEDRLWASVGHAVLERAAEFAGKTVAVAGGGETAAHQALALAGHARKVRLLVRGDRLKAIAPLRESVARHPRIRACYNSTVRRLLGEGRLEGVEWADGSGRIRRTRLDALFVLVGKKPFLPRLPKGRKAGLFFAGDAREGCARQVVAAAADGMTRAMECEGFLNDQSSIQHRRA